MEILFSTIIPAYNMEMYVQEAIESALQQEGIQSEIIVVNDGSTDKTLDIVRSFGNRVAIVNQENRGLASARNSGARVATGNYLAFLDADDIWLPGKLKAQSAKLREGYQIVYTNRFNIGHIGDLPEVQSDVVQMNEGDIWHELLYGNMITASSAVISKDLFQSLGGLSSDLRSCEDWDLWLRCAEHNTFGYCSEPLVKYRIHSSGLSRNYKYMCQMRIEVIARALASERAGRLSQIDRRKIAAQAWAISGWEAARAQDIKQSLMCYWSSLRLWPCNVNIWYDIVRVCAGRA